MANPPWRWTRQLKHQLPIHQRYHRTSTAPASSSRTDGRSTPMEQRRPEAWWWRVGADGAAGVGHLSAQRPAPPSPASSSAPSTSVPSPHPAGAKVWAAAPSSLGRHPWPVTTNRRGRVVSYFRLQKKEKARFLASPQREKIMHVLTPTHPTYIVPAPARPRRSPLRPS